MKVLIHLEPDPGDLATTLPLARALAARGHDVVYSTGGALAAAIEARGFRCAAVHGATWYRGAGAGAADARAWSAFEAAQRIADEYARGVIDAHVRAIDPAVIVADARATSPIQLVAFALRVPCLQLSLTLSQHLEEQLPPLTSALRPGASSLELQGARWVASCLRRPVGPWQSAMAVSAAADRLAARFGYPADGVSFDTALAPAFTHLGEWLAAPAALDLPRHGGAGGRHLAIPLDLERAEPLAPALAAFAAGGAPLIVVSLGEHAGDDPDARDLAAAVIAALRARPELRAVIAADGLVEDELPRLPPGVHLAAAASVPALLRGATALISRGGLLELRRAIAQHVPIIAVPREGDAQGNAVRIAHHGAGVHLPAYAASAEALAAVLDRVTITERVGFADRLRALAAACRAEESTARAVAAVEGLAPAAAGATRPGPPRPPERAPIAPAGPAAGWVFAAAAPADLDPARAIAATPGAALDAGDGPVLVQVERAGGRLRGLARHDATAALQAYAVWCAEAALAPAAATDPHRVALVRDLLAEHAAAGVSAARAEAIRAAVTAQAVQRWHHGYGAAALAIAGAPAANARRARREAIASLARSAPEAAAGPDAYRAAYLALVARFDAQLASALGVAARL